MNVLGSWTCAVVHPLTALQARPLPLTCSALLPRLQTMRIMTSWYLSKWSGAEVAARISGNSVDRITYIGGYLGFALGECSRQAAGASWNFSCGCC